MDYLFEKIRKFHWMGNNLILTGISLNDVCDKYEIKFDYDKDIFYQKFKTIKKAMPKRNCILKRYECPNEEQCINNLQFYTECYYKKNNCPEFEEDNCSIDQGLYNKLKKFF